MDSMENKSPKMQCGVCGEAARYCAPACQSCQSELALAGERGASMKRVLLALVHWATEYEGTWADGSDAEVALDEILEEARDLVSKELHDEA